MATANKKSIKPLVSILPLEPKDIDTFWTLAEFMVAEALKFSGKYADAKWIRDELKKGYSRKNLRVNTVSPGLVDTPLAKKITENPIILKASIKMLALDKIGKPEQISKRKSDEETSIKKK